MAGIVLGAEVAAGRETGNTERGLLHISSALQQPDTVQQHHTRSGFYIPVIYCDLLQCPHDLCVVLHVLSTYRCGCSDRLCAILPGSLCQHLGGHCWLHPLEGTDKRVIKKSLPLLPFPYRKKCPKKHLYKKERATFPSHPLFFLIFFYTGRLRIH